MRNSLTSELILTEIRTRQCRVPTIINHGRDTAVPFPLYYSGTAGIDNSQPLTVNSQPSTINDYQGVTATVPPGATTTRKSANGSAGGLLPIGL